MTSPGPTDPRCDLEEVTAVFSGSGGPLVRLREVVLGIDDESVALDFVAIRLDPASARELVLDEVRRRASMHPRFARWVIHAPTPY